MSCQKEIAKKITEKKANYVLSWKENQPRLYCEVEEYFIAAQENPQQYPEVTTIKTTDCGYGRVEQRTYYLSTEIDWYEDKGQWNGLCAIGMVHSKGTITQNCATIEWKVR